MIDAASLDIFGAICVLAIGVGIVLWRSVFSDTPPKPLPKNNDEKGWVKRGIPSPSAIENEVAALVETCSGAKVFEGHAAALEAELAKNLVELDAKASSMLSIVGGGAGFVAIAAGVTRFEPGRFSWLLVAALVGIIATLGSLLAVLWPRPLGLIDVKQLCKPALWLDPLSADKQAVLIAYERFLSTRRMLPVIVEKAKFLSYAQTFFVLAVVSLGMNAIVIISAPNSTDTSALTKAVNNPDQSKAPQKR